MRHRVKCDIIAFCENEDVAWSTNMEEIMNLTDAERRIIWGGMLGQFK
jgi:hypothetical protein